MQKSEIARYRLYNEHLLGKPFDQPQEVVAWLGAVQSQDYAGAKWGLAQRSQFVTDAQMDQLFADGAILRTHVMRPTWHFVAPADIRWLLRLTAPRVNAVNAYMYRKLELDETTLTRSNDIITKALAGGKQLTRDELGKILAQAGISTQDGMRLGYIVHRAELDGVVCSGGRRGKQFTYALLEERVPPVKALERDEALATLTQRFFTSHGPATVEDFAWWSGLTKADVRAGLATTNLAQIEVDGQTYYFEDNLPVGDMPSSSTVYLLPAYDEYTIAYKNHDAIFDPQYRSLVKTPVFDSVIVLDGQVIGSWRRTFVKKTAQIETHLYFTLTPAQQAALETAVQRFSAFLEMPAVLA